MPIDQPAQPPSFAFSAISGPLMSTWANKPALAIITGDGKVSINWDRVKEEAADPKSSFHAMALMILAARDGTATPISGNQQ